MNIQALGQLVIGRKRTDLTEDEKEKRRSQLEQQKITQRKEIQVDLKDINLNNL